MVSAGFGVSNHDPLDLIEAHLIAAAIIELRRARGGVIRHRGDFSSVPPFLREAVIPIARKLWLPSLVAIPAAAARWRIIA